MIIPRVEVIIGIMKILIVITQTTTKVTMKQLFCVLLNICI